MANKSSYLEAILAQSNHSKNQSNSIQTKILTSQTMKTLQQNQPYNVEQKKELF